MQYGICCVPSSNIKKEPSHKSELVSQALFGEYFEIDEINEDKWVRITGCYDGYKGWMLESHLDCIDVLNEKKIENALTKNLMTTISFDGNSMHLPIGSNLDVPKSFLERHGIKVESPIVQPYQQDILKKDFIEVALKYLNTTYVWGGKSNFGIDCSGFAQMVFKFINIPLLRDASLQATQGEDVGFLQEAKAGDLAFFDNEEGKITHVGILLNEHEIIHASGKVRIDPIDIKGIIHSDTGVRTHNLRLIKRYFNQ